jgi:hypothetical protein
MTALVEMDLENEVLEEIEQGPQPALTGLLRENAFILEKKRSNEQFKALAIRFEGLQMEREKDGKVPILPLDEMKVRNEEG